MNLVRQLLIITGFLVLILSLEGCGTCDKRKCLKSITRNTFIFNPALKMTQIIPVRVCIKKEEKTKRNYSCQD